MINKYVFSALLCSTFLVSTNLVAERRRVVQPERNVINRNVENRNIENRNPEGYIYPNAGTPIEINNTYVVPDNPATNTSTNTNGS